MERTDIIALASDLALDGASEDLLSEHLEKILNNPAGPLLHIETEMVSLTAGTGLMDFETDMLAPIEGIFTDRALLITTERQMESFEDTWRTTTGTPSTMVLDRLNRKYRLYPVPTANSDDLIPIHGEPLGEDYPDGWLILIYKQNRELALNDLYTLPLALQLIARESENSPDSDEPSMANAELLAQVIFQLLGV